VSSAPRRAVCSSGLKSAIYRMKKAIRKISGGNRPGAGRPATGCDPSRTFRLSDEFTAALDAWVLVRPMRLAVPKPFAGLSRSHLGASCRQADRQAGAPCARARACQRRDREDGRSYGLTRRTRQAPAPPYQGAGEFRAARVDQPKAKGK
jgi:hypothetical protein